MGRGDPGTRREFLAASGSTIVGLAGCIGTDEADPATTTNPTTSSSTTTRSPSTDPGFDLDLREANVLDVAFESSGDGSVQFDVTLLHDDDGEDGYADWWQVETPEGSQLGRRTLLHAHGTQPFTRSATVEIPAEVTCVVLRGHDQTHGYGGQAQLVDLETGDTRSIRQGSDPETVTAADCP